MRLIRSFLRRHAGAANALGLLLASSLVRSFGALAAVVLAGGLGTGVEMDHYMSLSLAVIAASSVLSIAVPSLLSRYATTGGLDTYVVGRAWARRLGNIGGALYAALVPAMAWGFLPAGAEGYPTLCGLMLLGVGAVWVAPRVAVEQTLHQHAGRPYFAMSGTALCLGIALGGAVVSALTLEVWWSAVALSLGAYAEYRFLKSHAKGSAQLPCAAGIPRFPWKDYGVFSLAASGAFMVGLIDQALLARMGSSAQSVWGLASKPAAFLVLSVFAVASSLATQALMAPGCSEERGRRVRRLCVSAFWGSALVLLLLWLGAYPLTALLYERGAFGPDETRETVRVLSATLWAYLLYPATAVLIRAVSAHANYAALLRATIVFFAVKLGVGVLWLPVGGYWAVALGTLAAMAGQGLCLWGPALKTKRPGEGQVSEESLSN